MHAGQPGTASAAARLPCSRQCSLRQTDAPLVILVLATSNLLAVYPECLHSILHDEQASASNNNTGQDAALDCDTINSV